MTAIELITRALRLIGSIDANEAPDAADARDALDVLNGLFAEWRGSGIPVPDYSVDTVQDELTLQASDKEAVAHQLAMRISPEYGRGLSVEARESREESWRRLQLRYFQPGRSYSQDLPCATGDFGDFSVTHG